MYPEVVAKGALRKPKSSRRSTKLERLALLAAANIYVARNFDESVWVNFKVFGITVAMLIFMVPQVLWLSGKTKTVQSDQAS